MHQYLGLPKDRTTFPILERESVYKEVISEFWNSLKNNDWDDQDKARAIFQLSSEKGLQIYRNIFIDEVQDLTELQLIALLSLVKPFEKANFLNSSNSLSDEILLNPSKFFFIILAVFES